MPYGYRDVLTRALMARRISRLTASAALAAVLGSAAADPAHAAGLPGIGADPGEAERALREHRMTTLDGRSLSLGDLHGQVVIVNFWASWCAPCRRELPRLSRLRTELPASVRVLAVSIDEDAGNAGRFCRAQNVKLEVTHDGPDGLARALDLKSVPLTLVVDRSGRVTYSTSRSDERGLSAVAAEARRVMALPAGSGGPAAGDPR